MNENENGVIDSGSPAEGSEHPSPEQNANLEAEGGTAEPKSGRENHIPISRAEEMWKKREEKLAAEFRTREDGYKKQLEDFTGKLTQGQLAWLKAMGWYKDEPEKPFTRAEVEKMLEEREAKIQRQMLVQTYEDRIRSGWEQVTNKFPELATNKRFQDATLASYSQNPNVPLVQHAEALVKELLDPYHTRRAAAVQQELDARKSPDRRVVPSGRGAGAGAGSKDEKKLSMAEKIRNRLKADREQ